MTIDMAKLVKLNALDKLAAVTSAGINTAQATADQGFKKGIVDGNTVKFYTDSNATLADSTAAFSFDFAAESFLDQAQTTFTSSFTFSTATFGTGTTDPNLDGKPVLTLAVKTVDAQNNETINYSFLNVEDLVDIYTVATDTTSQRVLNVSGNQITFKLSTDANNALETDATGLKVDITGKADKDTDATANNIAKFDANGNPVDAEIAANTLVLTSDIAPDSDVSSVLTSYFGTAAVAVVRLLSALCPHNTALSPIQDPLSSAIGTIMTRWHLRLTVIMKRPTQGLIPLALRRAAITNGSTALKKE